jgi:hypothetical protein
VIDRTFLSRFSGAMSATVIIFPDLNAMPENAAAALATGRRQRVDGTFE